MQYFTHENSLLLGLKAFSTLYFSSHLKKMTRKKLQFSSRNKINVYLYILGPSLFPQLLMIDFVDVDSLGRMLLGDQ